MVQNHVYANVNRFVLFYKTLRKLLFETRGVYAFELKNRTCGYSVERL